VTIGVTIGLIGISGGLVSLYEIPKIKDSITVLDFNYNKPK
jgi:hypothetical protein